MIKSDEWITSSLVHGGSGMAQTKSFGEMNFSHAQLGDKRRTKRLVKLADQMCQRPGGTLPQKLRSPADLQAFYRLMRQEDVTHEAIVCDRGADSFEFLEHEVASGRRFVIRSSYNRRILIAHDAPEASDTAKLHEYVRTLPEEGTWTLQVTSKVTSKVELRSPRRKGKKKTVKRKAREAKMAVAFAPVQIRPSTKKTGNYGNEPLALWIIRVWEVDPPKGQERLEWVLVTNEPVRSFSDAYRVVGWYECRWIIEEYHKGMKTGCRIESPQFTTEDRLQPTIALLSVVTLTLLQLRDASRRPDAKTRKAKTVISPLYVEVLSLWRHKKVKSDWTVHDYYYALARLGGHQNRKHDHPPGWQVIWEGWKELLPMVTGYHAAKTRYQKCG